jgi:hypothetical protein
MLLGIAVAILALAGLMFWVAFRKTGQAAGESPSADNSQPPT